MTDQTKTPQSSGTGCAAWVAILALLAGLALAGFGGKKLVDSWALFTTGEAVTGTVSGYQTSLDENNNTRHQAIITYQAGSEVYSYKDPGASIVPKWAVGAPVELLYLPGQPELAVINNPVDLWVNPLLPIAAGLIGVVVGVVVFLGRKR